MVLTLSPSLWFVGVTCQVSQEFKHQLSALLVQSLASPHPKEGRRQGFPQESSFQLHVAHTF